MACHQMNTVPLDTIIIHTKAIWTMEAS
uniref:NERD domain-containing protein n=1 Tax=Arundo donax TaxID=35708 RepID=A0A0A8ZWY7_ARUDO